MDYTELQLLETEDCPVSQDQFEQQLQRVCTQMGWGLMETSGWLTLMARVLASTRG